MSSGTVKVLSTWRSVFGVRVLIALKEKGVEYEYEEQDLVNKSKLLLESNPVHKKVPVLIHNGKAICESLIIVQYIDETWPSKDEGFLPQDPYKRALVRFWADYVDKKFYEACVLAVQNVEGELMEQSRSIIKECVVTLDGALKDVFGGGGPYFGGEHLNLVDITLASYICWFETLETLGNFKILDEGTCPHLCAWTKVVVQQPSVQEGLATAPSQKVLESVYWMRKTFFSISQ